MRLLQYADFFYEALKDFNAILNLDPYNVQAFVERGICYEYLSQYDNAIRDFDTVLKLDPENVRAHLQRGIIFRDNFRFKTKQRKLAIKDFSKAIKLSPDYADAYHNRGVCWRELGDEAKAQADFAKAKQLGSK